MNNRGDVVGYSTTPFIETSQAFLYKNGRTTHIGTLYGHRESTAMAINDAGAIVGRCGVPFLYEGGIMQDITLYLGGDSGYATAINSKNEVVGYVLGGGGGLVPFYYDPVGGVMPLVWLLPPSVAASWTINYVSDINDSGMITGYGSTANGTHGFILNGTNLTDLGDVITVNAINSAGQAVGLTKSGYATLWSGTNTTYISYYSTTPNDINDSGQVVGNYANGNSSSIFLYDLETRFDLNSLILGTNTAGCTLNDARCINNNGQIVVNGTTSYNNSLIYRSFLLTPVPIIRNATNSSTSTMNLTFWSMTNHTYTVQSSVGPSVWKDLTNVSGIAGDLTIPVATTNGPQRFYRVRMD
jgi:probable HAF family extracellular repeat protein